jgi:regulator of sirC expression with transglutaminase-like and TPR domain
MSPQDALEAVGKAGTGDVDLAGAALALAALARPGLDLKPYVSHLADLAARGARDLSGSPDDPRAIAAASAAALRDAFGYDGDRATYDDLRNADLAHVIDRRRGLPVALGILYVHVARALGASAHGINFPGHFLIGIGTGRGAVMLDPFHGGRVLDGDDLEALLPPGTELTQQQLAALSDKGTLIRLQNNILTRSRIAGDWTRAAQTLETLTQIAPDMAQFRFELGDAYTRIEQPNAARAALQTALAAEPQAPWAAQARALLSATTRSLN